MDIHVEFHVVKNTCGDDNIIFKKIEPKERNAMKKSELRTGMIVEVEPYEHCETIYMVLLNTMNGGILISTVGGLILTITMIF